MSWGVALLVAMGCAAWGALWLWTWTQPERDDGRRLPNGHRWGCLCRDCRRILRHRKSSPP